MHRWGQTYLLESLMYFVPEEQEDAELLAERISVRLQHANSAVILTTIKVILYLMNYMGDQDVIESMCRKLSPPLGPFLLVFSTRLTKKDSGQLLCFPLAMKFNTSHSATFYSSYKEDLQYSKKTSKSSFANTMTRSMSSWPNWKSFIGWLKRGISNRSLLS